MKELQCLLEVSDLMYGDIYIHLCLDHPEGFKVYKFNVNVGKEYLLEHIKSYSEQLMGVGNDEGLLMRLFSRSPIGESPERLTS